MWNYTKNIRLSWLAVVAALTMLTSCLDNGEETISLEEGNPYEMITGNWQVTSASLLLGDEEEGRTVSDLPDDALWKAQLSFSQSGTYNELRRGSTVPTSRPYSISGDGLSYGLNLNGSSYEITSMGKRRMYLWQYVMANGETAIKQYVLDKTGDLAQTPDDDNSDVNQEDDRTTVVTSDEYKNIQYGSYSLTVPKGAVPKNDKGGAGRVAFSFKLTDEYPAALPANLEAAGRVLKIEPMNFTFASPLTLKVPASVASGLYLYHYDMSTQQWTRIPFSAQDATSATVSITSLGYFILARERNATPLGGIKISISDNSYDANYLYYATILSVSGANTEAAKTVGTTVAAQGRAIYIADVPKNATYTMRIVRERRTNLKDESTRTEYTTRTVTAYVQQTLTKTGNKLENCTGWTNVTANFSTSDWQEGRPEEWGTTTTTYGTGKFQATLTWVNSQNSTTDYDLHLYGPNDLHVYFGNKNQGCFELDRDWLHTIGNAVENLYSIDDNFPPGNYTVKVHHFSGVTGKPYNCRIIVNNTVVASHSGSISTNKAYDEIYNFTIQ